MITAACTRGTSSALAEEMRLALAEVYEVASFYAHFDIVMDDETPPPPITVRVCDSLTCALSGGERLLDELRERLGDGVRVVRAPCMGGCDKAPVVAIGHALHENATADSVAEAVGGRAYASAHLPDYPGLDALPRRRRLSAAAGLPRRRAHARRRDRARSKLPGCAGSAAPGFRPGANGALCGRSRGRG